MRLLHRTGKAAYTLTRDLVCEIPPYAILSHTWGNEYDEVTFKDFSDGTAESKPGYLKIRFCGEQAASDGVEYFWIDTCCIDKSSSAELSEAINSMFRWYQGAAKCYVYLSDVSSTGDDVASVFQNSRWFTRGWTLQELIAPASVEFFSSDGGRLGDKKSKEQEIHMVTGVAIKALQGHSLSNFSVADRMSWASKRRTTRKEDEAYCLMGIFGIYMPMIYGEGSNAWIRLGKEIEKHVMPTPEPLLVSWLSGYVFRGVLRHCVVFSELRREIKCSPGRDRAEVKRVFEKMTSRGFRTHHLTSCYDLDNTPRYFHLFRPAYFPGGTYILPSAEAFDAKNTELTQLGYTCLDLHVSSKGSKTIWCGVWEKLNGAYDTIVRHSLTYGELCEVFYAHCWDRITAKSLGYRDENGACAYEQNGVLRFATVISNRLSKSGISRGFFTKYLLTRTQLEIENEERMKQGFVIETVNPIVFESEERFNVTWDKRSGTSRSKVKMYLGITSEELQTAITEHTDGSCIIDD